MRVHQVTHLFYPDQLAGAALYSDLAGFLQARGHEIHVTTTFSYYPALRFAEKDRRVLVRDEKFAGIPLRRVSKWLPHPHKGWRRLVPEVTFLAGLTAFGRFPGWTPDIVVVACPMLAQVAWQRWAYLGHGIPKLVILQDSMAHAATELGIIKSPLLGRALHGFERWSLKGATMISTISEGMRDRVNGITGGAVPCVVTPNWIHQSLADCVAARRALGRSRAADRLFYSGNFGVKQGLPGFLKDFREVHGHWRISVHGAGAEADTLARETAGWGDWLQVGSLQEEPAYVDSLLTCSACLVTQMPGVGANFLPSKLLPALCAGTPVLAVCDAASPLGREVNEGGFGAVIPPGDKERLKAVLEQWHDQPERLRMLSDNALKRAQLYSRERSCGAYEQLLYQLVEDSKRKH